MAYNWQPFASTSGAGWVSPERFNNDPATYAQCADENEWIVATLDAPVQNVGAIRILSKGFKPPFASVAVTVSLMYSSVSPPDWQVWQPAVNLAADGYGLFRFDVPTTMLAVRMAIDDLNTAIALMAFTIQWGLVVPSKGRLWGDGRLAAGTGRITPGNSRIRDWRR